MASEAHPSNGAHPGVLHFIPHNLSAFEPIKPLTQDSKKLNTLLWIGGMFDTPLSVTYPLTIAQSLGPNWSVATASLGSAGLSWGVASIRRDADDMAKITAYFKRLRPEGKLVIMGHSTGCQDCMEYVVGEDAETRTEVDGAILQAPVSDREAANMGLPDGHLEKVNILAKKWCDEGKEKDCLPYSLTKLAFGRIGITARRWLDICAPGGADDYFSSDLSDEQLRGTFGRFPKSTQLLILYSGADESVPKSVDKHALVQRWMNIAESADQINCGVVEGADHNYNGQSYEIVQDMVKRVQGFLERIEQSDGGALEPSKSKESRI